MNRPIGAHLAELCHSQAFVQLLGGGVGHFKRVSLKWTRKSVSKSKYKMYRIFHNDVICNKMII